MEATLLTVVAVLLGLILVTLWVVLYQLVKQQGRILLRQDNLEHRLMHVGMGVSTNGPLGMGMQRGPKDLDIGTHIPPFRLPDLTGKEVALEDLRGKRVLLIHWSPQCGFCDLIVPDLARLQPDLQKRNVQVLLVAHGNLEANRKLAEEHGLEFTILLQKDGVQPPEVFSKLGTPAAYLLDEQGRVARPLAVGAEHVVDLAYEVATEGAKAHEGVPEGSSRKRLPGEKPLSQSKLERNGLKAGTPAPPFRLPDVDGGVVSLEEYRGRRVLLVFSDPHCGPCDQLAPHLVRLHRQHLDDGMAVIMVGRGDPEENRRKAEAHGFEFPVALQKRWELSKEYGIFATPVAFLIDKDGVIARNVARGPNEILTLIAEDLPAGRV